MRQEGSMLEKLSEMGIKESMVIEEITDAVGDSNLGFDGHTNDHTDDVDVDREMATNAGEKYVTLEQTEGSFVKINSNKKSNIEFYNPLKDSENFERNFSDQEISRNGRNRTSGVSKHKGIVKQNTRFNYEEKGLVISTANSDNQFLRPFFFNKLPGQLHFVVESIHNYKHRNDGTKVSIRVEVINRFAKNNFEVYESEEIEVRRPEENQINGREETRLSTKRLDGGSGNSPNTQKSVKIGHHIKLPIEKLTDGTIKLKVILLQTKNSVSSKCCECNFELDRVAIDTFHNKLIEMSGNFTKYSSNGLFKTNIFKSFSELFYSPELPAESVKTYCSYLSDDEVPTINSPSPSSLFTLSKWLVVRKYAYDLMFAGYINIKGDVNEVSSYLWKRRYVKWYGYTLYIFNEHTKRMVGSLNIADSTPNSQSLGKGIVGFKVKNMEIELHCDTSEKIRGITEALTILFPKVLNDNE